MTNLRSYVLHESFYIDLCNNQVIRSIR